MRRKIVKEKTNNKKERFKMKTKRNNTMARLTGITIGLALFAGVAGVANAQFKPAADDGTYASPKLRQQLDDQTAWRNTAPAAAASMACPRCKDEYYGQIDRTARGANKPLVFVARHLCGGCETTIAVEGTGKARHDVAIHKCNSCGVASLACCSTKKSGEATKGMEMKFEVAPLK
jgi:hypothetical protein